MATTAMFADLHPPTRSGPISMIAVAAVLFPLATISVLLRTWVRLKILKSWGQDDWAIVMTLVLFAAKCGVLIKTAMIERHGITMAGGEIIALLVPTEQSLYVAGTITLKLSLSTYYLRFLRSPWQRHTIILSTAIYTIFAVAIILTITFECGIPSYQQMEKSFTGQCIPFSTFEAISIAHGVLNAITDCIFALLPIGVLLKCKLPLATKISASFVVGLAVLGTLASCARTAYIPGLRPTRRFYVTSVDAMVWTVVEPGLGITAACAATLRPLFRGCLKGAGGVVGAAGSRVKGRTRKEEMSVGRSQTAIYVTETMVKGSARRNSRVDWEMGRDVYTNFEYRDDLERGSRGNVVTTIVGNARGDDMELVDLKDILRS